MDDRWELNFDVLCFLGQSFLHEIADAGVYNGQFKLKAEPDPDCDPTQGFCEMWLPGNYTVKIGKFNPFPNNDTF